MSFSRRPGARFNRGRVAGAAAVSSAAVSSRTPLGDAMWRTDGAYLDLRDSAYDGVATQGVAMSADIIPRLSVGGGAFSPNAGPTWDLITIGGRRTLKSQVSTSQALNGHFLSGLMNGTAKTLTLIARFRVDINGTRILWGFGNSAKPVSDFCEGFASGINVSMNSRQGDDSGAIVTPTVGSDLTFAPVVAAWVFTGTQVYQYSEVAGVMTLQAGYPKACSVGNIIVNQFRWGSAARTAYGSMDLHLQCLAMTSQQLTQAQLQTVYNSWVGDDVPAGAGTKIAFFGDSITMGAHDSGEGGFRRYFWNDCQAAGKATDHVGALSAGNFPEAQHDGYSGFEINGILAQANSELGTGGLFAPKFVVWMAGTNNVNNGGSAVADALTDTTAALDALHTKITQIDPTARIVVASLPDQNGFTNEVNTFNAGQQTIIANFNAAHPGNQAIFWDANTAIGPNGPTYFADGAHPNSPGYALLGHSLYAVLGPLIP